MIYDAHKNAQRHRSAERQEKIGVVAESLQCYKNKTLPSNRGHTFCMIRRTLHVQACALRFTVRQQPAPTWSDYFDDLIIKMS